MAQEIGWNPTTEGGESHKVGGSGGNSDLFIGQNGPNNGVLTGLNIFHGIYIDALQGVYHRGGNAEKYGGPGGKQDTTNTNAIRRIEFRAGNLIDGITIYFTEGEKKSFGGSGGKLYGFNIPDGYQFSGFKGRYGIFIDSLQVLLRKV